MRQTIVDIARAARVSTATVDRVLQRAAGVRGLTRARVLAAARAIGYLPDTEPGRRPRRPCGCDFVLQSGPNTFMDLLAAHLERRGARARRRGRPCSVHRVDGFSPEALAASLRELRGDQRRHRHHRARSPGGPRGDPRDRGAPARRC